jgi:hypothetical protein
LTVDQSAQLDIIETGVLNVRHKQKVVRDEQRAHSIQKWLAAPNVAANQMQKQSERQNDTGIWLLRLSVFEQWLLWPKLSAMAASWQIGALLYSPSTRTRDGGGSGHR